MSQTAQQAKTDSTTNSARDWQRVLAGYREPDELRSTLEIVMTGGLFVALWVAAWLALSVSYWLTLAICVPAAGMLLRLFLIQHDCGHGAFFRRRAVNDWVGRVLGVLTMSPYDVWRGSHAIHHATSGNLAKRGAGDIDTMTIREYRALSPLRRVAYRIYRHPLILFGLGPAYFFLFKQRLPYGFPHASRLYWVSAMGTNAAIALVAGLLIYFLGVGPFLLVQLPVIIITASTGVWLFYVQHQFEDTFWAEGDEWKLSEAALYGSSHYDLPGVLRWVTANIGVHHVHHLCSRIPYYRLQEVLHDFPELAAVRRLTLMQSFACARFRLWDEERRKLVTFAAAGELQPEKT